MTGIGAFRAVHILLWQFIAYDAEIDVPDEILYDLAGPNVRLMERMCQYAGFSYKQLYKKVKEELPHMAPIEYEVWTCKVVNFIFLLNMVKHFSKQQVDDLIKLKFGRLVSSADNPINMKSKQKFKLNLSTN